MSHYLVTCGKKGKMSRRLFFQIFGCVLFFMVGQYDRIESNLVRGEDIFEDVK